MEKEVSTTLRDIIDEVMKALEYYMENDSFLEL